MARNRDPKNLTGIETWLILAVVCTNARYHKKSLTMNNGLGFERFFWWGHDVVFAPSKKEVF